METFLSICWCLSYWPLPSSASSRVPGRPAAGRVVPGPRGGASSARCCSPSPRRWLTCLTMSATGSNPQPPGPATESPALVVTVTDRMAAWRRTGRRRMTERSFTTGSTTVSQSAQRVVVEVGGTSTAGICCSCLEKFYCKISLNRRTKMVAYP